MSENPYKSPKEVDSQPTVKAGIAVGVLLLTSIPAGCICGGITCYSVGVSGELSAKALGYEQNADVREMGWTLGIPVALVVMVLIPVLAILIFGRRKTS